MGRHTIVRIYIGPKALFSVVHFAPNPALAQAHSTLGVGDSDATEVTVSGRRQPPSASASVRFLGEIHRASASSWPEGEKFHVGLVPPLGRFRTLLHGEYRFLWHC